MRLRQKLKPIYACVLFALASPTVMANPLDPTVVSGQASFASSGSTLTVTNTPGTIINWQGFSIGANEITRFAQQSASSAVLNRVISNNPSSILGTLQSNGRVFLINPNGIVFGAGSVVNVAGLVASTLNLSDADFLAGRGHFTEVPGAASISNAGDISAQEGGQIFLIAPNVENTGVITAPNGEILLAAGYSVDLVSTSDPDLRVNITAPAGDATNVGQLIASSGSLGLFGTVVRNSGAVSADSATLQGGKIMFKASQRVEAGGTISAKGAGGGEIKMLADMQTGTVNVTGTLDASAPVSGDGGFIDTSAAHVQVADTAHVTTAAANGKSGNWLIDPLDFTIAATDPLNGSSYMSNATLAASLVGGDVTIQTLAGTGNGDIFVNDVVDWNIYKLTLSAARNININANLNGNLVGAAGGSLALEYGQGAVALGNTSVYKLAPGAQINLLAGPNFSTKLGNDAVATTYTVITALGAEGSMTGADLQGMNFDLAGNYVLGANIDASNTSNIGIWTSGLGFAPVGVYTTTPFNYSPFTGQFDGLGHTISNLYINRPTETNVGLFGYANGASIRNVALTGANITGLNDVGGLAGQIYGTVSNSSVNGIVKGSYGVGGLAGYNSGTISDSFAAGAVSGISNVGGLAGYSYGTIGNSYVSSGSVTGTSYVGGLVGSNNSGVLNNSHYDITNVIINAGSYVTLGGLYNAASAGQYNDWITNGLSLNIDTYNALNGGSFTGALGGTSYTINSVQGMKDLLGFADNAAYTFTLGSTIDLVNDTGLYIPYLAADFNGNNFTISSLNVNLANDNLGLFGNIASTGTVSNVVLSDALVTGRSNIGALAGWNQGTVSGSHVDNSIAGRVSGNSNVGGLVGDNSGAISISYVNNSYVNINGNVSGAASNVGGLAGYNNGTISGSYVSGGSVNGSGWNVGGLVGYNACNFCTATNGVRTQGIISNSYVSGGTVTGTDRVGGLVGYDSFGTIGNSHVDTGTIVNGGNYVGGLVGYDGGEGFIYGNTVTGATVTGNSYVGGLVGEVAQARYFIGYTDNNHVVDSAVSGGSSGSYAGGLIGWNGGIIRNNSYVSGGSVSGGSNVGGLVGYNDLVGSSSISGMPVIYGGRISTSYTSGGTVTGSMDVGGLVGYNAGSISGSHVDNSIAGSVSGTSNVGGLAGNNAGVVSGSYVSGGSVTGSSNVGGLVGLNGGTTTYAGIGTISNSYVNNGTIVSGSNNVGGLVGYNGGGSISDTYVSNGVVTGSSAGGLVGYNNGGFVSNSYVSGGSVGGGGYAPGGVIGQNDTTLIGSVSGTLWDVGLAGVTNGIGYDWVTDSSTDVGATGLTAVNMMTMSSFTNWDIANTGGMGAIWRIYEGHTTPLLTSFLTPLILTDAPDLTVSYNGSLQSGGTTTIGGVLGAAASGTNAGFYNGYYSTQLGYDIVGGNLTINTSSVIILVPTVIDEIVNTSLMFSPDTGSARSTSSNEEDKAKEEILANMDIKPVDGTAGQPLPVCN